MRRISSFSRKLTINLLVPALLLFAGGLTAVAQNAGFDLFQTGTGTSVTLPNIGVVPLQGVPIQGTTGNTDTIIHRTQSVPAGGGTVPVNVFALFMKSTSPVNFNGSSADVYVTLNNSGGMIPTSVLPQPDSLSASTGSLNVHTGGTFDSNLTVNADIIFVKAGTSVTNSANYLGHQPAPSTALTSTGSTWSTTPPAGYPGSTSYPSGGFYAISTGGGGHSTPTHVHAVIPAKCSSGTSTTQSGAMTANVQMPVPVTACVVAIQ
ncbi:MAG TPA: hypothetical protein VFY05_05090 [Candidatus Angelobacter sp.]|nr:hypothetical protein [Candidatus Angelobacter sp.]